MIQLTQEKLKNNSNSSLLLSRYIVVVHPFKLVGFLSRSKCRLAVFFLWLLAWILSIPVIFSTVGGSAFIKIISKKI